jgi:hypothetical protein
VKRAPFHHDVLVTTSGGSFTTRTLGAGALARLWLAALRAPRALRYAAQRRSTIAFTWRLSSAIWRSRAASAAELELVVAVVLVAHGWAATVAQRTKNAKTPATSV